MSRRRQEDGRGTEQDLAGAENRITRGRSGEDRANAQISLPGCTGDRNSDWVMSPTPLVLLSRSGSGWLIKGMMVREITFQSAFKCIGTTG